MLVASVSLVYRKVRSYIYLICHLRAFIVERFLVLNPMYLHLC